jgi:hypothetical protein
MNIVFSYYYNKQWWILVCYMFGNMVIMGSGDMYYIWCVFIMAISLCCGTIKPALVCPIETIPLISEHMQLEDMSKLIRSCKTYYDAYNQVAVHGTITHDTWRTMQFGVSRLLLQNISLSMSLECDEYINVLAHYANTNNRHMFNHIIAHESESNKSHRRSVLGSLKYYKPQEQEDIDNNMRAFRGMSNDQTHTCFIDAIKWNNEIAVKLFIKSQSCNLSTIRDEQYGNVLSVAVACNKINLVKLLIRYKFNVNFRQRFHDFLPLCYAIQEGNIDMIKLLLDHGADANCKVHELSGQTILEYVQTGILYGQAQTNRDLILELLTRVREKNSCEKRKITL